MHAVRCVLAAMDCRAALKKHVLLKLMSPGTTAGGVGVLAVLVSAQEGVGVTADIAA